MVGQKQTPIKHIGYNEFMDNLIFLDTETTGNDFFKDRLFQVCYSFNDKISCEYFKPSVPISVKAQSITHVTYKIVEDKKPFEGSLMQKDLQGLLKENILIAHNAVFDIAMLTKEGVETPRFICTLKVARFLDQEAEIPEYNLQYLRYFFELDVKADAHDAKSDVIVLKALFEYQLKKMVQLYGSREGAIAEMIRISKEPFLFKIFPFGKYKGRKVEEISQLDKNYLEWLLVQKMQNGKENEEDWIFTLKHHLKVQ